MLCQKQETVFISFLTLTLSGAREKHLGLQPDGPVLMHSSCGRGVGQSDQVLALLLLWEQEGVGGAGFR